MDSRDLECFYCSVMTLCEAVVDESIATYEQIRAEREAFHRRLA